MQSTRRRNGIACIPDHLKQKGAVESAIRKINDGEELFEKKEHLMTLSDNYNIFTAAGDDMSTRLKFIMKTDEIKAPEIIGEVTAAKEENQGFFAWCKNILQKIRNKV